MNESKLTTEKEVWQYLHKDAVAFLQGKECNDTKAWDRYGICCALLELYHSYKIDYDLYEDCHAVIFGLPLRLYPEGRATYLGGNQGKPGLQLRIDVLWHLAADIPIDDNFHPELN